MTAGTIAPTVRAHDHEMTSPRPLATVITPLPRKAEYHILNLGAGSQSSLLKELFDAGEILASSSPGDTILDPFGGSGTTGQVALENGRSAILVDVDAACLEMQDERCTLTPAFAL